jgi:hypothetical protein
VRNRPLGVGLLVLEDCRVVEDRLSCCLLHVLRHAPQHLHRAIKQIAHGLIVSRVADGGLLHALRRHRVILRPYSERITVL